jgi:uncharacterized protein YqeY
MNLSEKISGDLKTAMKSGDSIKLNTIRSIRALLIELTKKGSDTAITPDAEISVLLAAAKKRKEAIEMYEKAGRKDLADQEKYELEIINTYLPAQIGKEEAEKFVRETIKNAGASTQKDMGKVMPMIIKELKGRIDGKLLQELVKQNLEG